MSSSFFPTLTYSVEDSDAGARNGEPIEEAKVGKMSSIAEISAGAPQFPTSTPSLRSQPSGNKRASSRKKKDKQESLQAAQQAKIRVAEQRAAMYAAALQAERRAILKVQTILFDGVLMSSQLEAATGVLTQADFRDVVSERAIADMCGYPPCFNRLPEPTSRRRGKFHISISEKKIYNNEELNKFCSHGCYVKNLAMLECLPVNRMEMLNEQQLERIVEAVRNPGSASGGLAENNTIVAGSSPRRERVVGQVKESNNAQVIVEPPAADSGRSDEIEGYTPRRQGPPLLSPRRAARAAENKSDRLAVSDTQPAASQLVRDCSLASWKLPDLYTSADLPPISVSPCDHKLPVAVVVPIPVPAVASIPAPRNPPGNTAGQVYIPPVRVSRPLRRSSETGRPPVSPPKSRGSATSPDPLAPAHLQLSRATSLHSAKSLSPRSSRKLSGSSSAFWDALLSDPPSAETDAGSVGSGSGSLGSGNGSERNGGGAEGLKMDDVWQNIQAQKWQQPLIPPLPHRHNGLSKTTSLQMRPKSILKKDDSEKLSRQISWRDEEGGDLAEVLYIPPIRRCLSVSSAVAYGQGMEGKHSGTLAPTPKTLTFAIVPKGKDLDRQQQQQQQQPLPRFPSRSQGAGQGLMETVPLRSAPRRGLQKVQRFYNEV